MQAQQTISITELIDSRPLARMQYVVIALCVLVVLLDGLDHQAIGLAAPAITQALKIPHAALGTVFSAALAGLAIGAFLLGMVADRIGRKPVLIGTTLCFGVFTLCTATASTLNELLVYRFLTGLGLGGAMPSFISLTSEYAPRRLRATIVSLVWTGVPVGGMVGALLGSWIIPAVGWQSIFVVGGVLPIITGILLFFTLPESLEYLVNCDAPAERIARAVRRAFPNESIPQGCRFVLTEQRVANDSLRRLFTDGRASGTILLWLSYFATFLVLVTNFAWSPTLLRTVGIEVSQSALAMAVFNAGSVVGTSLAGYLVTRFSAALVLPTVFVGGGVAMSLIGYATPSISAVILLEGLVGLFVGCGSSGLIALTALFYPIKIRSTGIGWAMGLGRLGSFVGPLVVGLLVGLHWEVEVIFVAIGIPVFVAAVASGFIPRCDEKKKDSEAAPGAVSNVVGIRVMRSPST